MVNSRIVVIGSLDREPKINEDGTVDLILTNVIDEDSRKDIREKGNSVLLVKLSKAQFKSKRKILYKENIEVKIIGHIKASVNKKGIPFIYVSAQLLEVKKIQLEEKEENKNVKPSQNFNGVLRQMKIANKKHIPWREQVEDSDFIELDSSQVFLLEEGHKNAKFNWLDLEKGQSFEKYIVAVRKIDEENYALVSGISRYIIAKLFNKKLTAYVTDLTREEFANEFEIKENNI